MDVVIPLVFPDYLIATDLPKSVRVPDMLPILDILPDSIKLPQKLADAGHAGVLFIKGASGLTRYYEYGRYDSAHKGEVRKRVVPDAKASKGKVDVGSLKEVLSRISITSGQGGRISGVYIQVQGKFKVMDDFAQSKVKENQDAARQEYNLLSHSCVHFMKAVVEAGGVDTPYIIDPRPLSYVQKLRDKFPKLDYDPRTKKMAVDGA